MNQRQIEIAVGLLFVVFAGVTLAFWIPADIDSGIIEKVRRREKMGDALFPTAIAAGILLVSLIHIASGIFSDSREKPSAVPGGRFILRFIVIVGGALLLMRYAGPLLIELLNLIGMEDASYRQLRDTAPYKYVGFVCGGMVLVVGLTALIQGRPSRTAFLVAVVSIAVLILLYDVPFDNLLLPPNGDV